MKSGGVETEVGHSDELEMRKSVDSGRIRQIITDNETHVFRADTLLTGVLVCLSIYLAMTTVSRLFPGRVQGTEADHRISG